MAFGNFANAGNALGGSAAGAGGLTSGPDLETIQTEVGDRDDSFTYCQNAD